MGTHHCPAVKTDTFRIVCDMQGAEVFIDVGEYLAIGDRLNKSDADNN